MSGIKILRRPAVVEKVGMSRCAIDRLIADNGFPKPVKLGPRNIGWVNEEIEDWLIKRIEERDSELNPA